MNSAALTYSELHSTYINSKQTTVPPAHHWYEAKRPGGSLFLQCSRKEKTILTRFRSGHLRTLTFRDEWDANSKSCKTPLCLIWKLHSLKFGFLWPHEVHETPKKWYRYDPQYNVQLPIYIGLRGSWTTLSCHSFYGSGLINPSSSVTTLRCGLIKIKSLALYILRLPWFKSDDSSPHFLC
ncbi:RNase H domain-containing protein [Trichonephila clavipes]|nr:RNase H domain-containing protein [Trichonephila clavipes]